MLGLPYWRNDAYINRTLRLIAFYICANGSVSNQHAIVQFGGVAMSNARLLVGAVSHESSGISVDMSCTSGGLLTSSHSQNTSISQPRYSGILAY